MSSREIKQFIEYYYSKHLRWRTVTSLVCSIAVLPLVFFSALSAFSFQPLSPFAWIENCLWMLMSLKFWVWCGAVAVSLLPLFSISRSKFSVLPSIVTRRIDYVFFFVSPLHVALVSSCCLATCATSFATAGLLGGVSSVADAGDVGNRKSQNHLMTLCLGLMMGVYLPFYFDRSRYYQFKFSILRIPFLVRVKSGLRQVLVKTLRNSLVVTFVVHLLNCLLAFPYLKASYFGRLFPDEQMEMLDYGAIYLQFATVVLTHVVCGLPLLFYNVVHTQSLEFPISSKFSGDGFQCLAAALLCKEFPLLQHHAALDLSTLAVCNRKRRAELFSLSVPGNRPLHWQAVVGECLDQLNSFSGLISSHVFAALEASSSGVLPGEEKTLQQAAHHPAGVNDVHTPASGLRLRSADNTSDGGFASSPSQGGGTSATRFSRLRNASATVQERRSDGVSGGPFLSFSSSKYPQKEYVRSDKLPLLTEKLAVQLKKCRPFLYFFGEIAEMKNRKLFSEARKYVWLVQGVSALTLHSFGEDHFGVAQSSLGSILTCLLTLFEALSKPILLSTPGKRQTSSETKMRMLLRTETKSAIYQITVTFREGLSSLELPQDLRSRLDSFREFRE